MHLPTPERRQTASRPSAFARAVRALLWTCSVSVLAQSAQALDTDIYFDRSVGVQPNVVFYLDSSGSMTSLMTAPAQYNQATTYAGPFNSTKLYYSLDGTVPSSTVSVQSGLVSFLHCETARAHIYDNNWGFFTGRFVARLPDEISGNNTTEDVWMPLVNGTWNPSSPHLLECIEDQQTGPFDHGENGTFSDAYASTSTSDAWTSDQSDEISWDSIGWATVMTGNYINYKLAPPAGPNLSRIDVMRQIIKELAQRFPMINAGIASLNTSEGASIDVPVMDISDTNARQVFETAIDGIVASGTTPLAEGLYEV